MSRDKRSASGVTVCVACNPTTLEPIGIGLELHNEDGRVAWALLPFDVAANVANDIHGAIADAAVTTAALPSKRASDVR